MQEHCFLYHRSEERENLLCVWHPVQITNMPISVEQPSRRQWCKKPFFETASFQWNFQTTSRCIAVQQESAKEIFLMMRAKRKTLWYLYLISSTIYSLGNVLVFCCCKRPPFSVSVLWSNIEIDLIVDKSLRFMSIRPDQCCRTPVQKNSAS